MEKASDEVKRAALRPRTVGHLGEIVRDLVKGSVLEKMKLLHTMAQSLAGFLVKSYTSQVIPKSSRTQSRSSRTKKRSSRTQFGSSGTMFFWVPVKPKTYQNGLKTDQNGFKMD